MGGGEGNEDKYIGGRYDCAIRERRRSGAQVWGEGWEGLGVWEKGHSVSCRTRVWSIDAVGR